MLGRDANITVSRGYVRSEDEPRNEIAVQNGHSADAIGQGGEVEGPDRQPSDNDDDRAPMLLPEQLVMELTAHWALAPLEA